MKKLVALILALILALAVAVAPAAAEEQRQIVIRYGALSMLNMTEEDMTKYMIAAWQIARTVEAGQVESAFSEGDLPKVSAMPKTECIYYDSLDAMIMALNAGEISSMIIYNTVADYLCAQNDLLVKSLTTGEISEDQVFATIINDTLSTNDFAFMMMEGNEALRDEFSAAIKEIREDGEGTLARLAAEYIDAPIAGGEIMPIELPVIEGAETIRVAVTGSLPPMDYIAPDGTPAGFNTALLAEISRRIGKNIELVQVDSIGRAAALSSGTVDAVFWTRTNQTVNEVAGYSEEEKAAKIEELNAKMTDNQIAALERVKGLVDIDGLGKADMPDGTIITEPYYSDTIVPVISVNLYNNIKKP